MLSKVGVIICSIVLAVQPLSAKGKYKVKKKKVNVVKTYKASTDKTNADIKFPLTNDVNGISKYALKLEQEWRMLDAKISYLTRQISDDYSDINAQNRAFADNISRLNGSDSTSETAFMANYKQIANKRYRDVAQKCEDLKKLEHEIKHLKSKQDIIVRKAQKLACNIEHNLKIANDVSKLASDTILDIADKARDVVDLFAKVDLERSAGALRSFTKCKSTEPHIYPVESVLLRKEFSYSSNKQFKFVTANITTRANSFVFSPCYGTILFFADVGKLGKVIIIDNTASTVMICGVDCNKYCSMGNVLYQGQIIGKACNVRDEYSDIKYVVRTKNSNLSEKR